MWRHDHPVLSALMWATLGFLAATLLLLAAWTLYPSGTKSDAELDREAAEAHC